MTRYSCRRLAVWLAVAALSGLAAPLSGQVLIREVISREHSIHVGGVDVSPPKEAFSREVTFSVENGRDGYAEVVSREVDVLVSDAAVPPPVSDIVTTVSPTGDSVTLDWTAYNPLAIGDILEFRIYLSDDGPFSDVTGLTPFLVVGGGVTTATLTGLTPYRDHYLAVVAVDGLGNFNPVVDYAAGYVLSPQVISREVSLFVGQEPDPPYREAVSREYDLVISTPEPPPVITDLSVAASASGDAATLDWSSYNQWAVGDIVRFDIYLSDDGAFSDVTGLTPVASAGTGASSFTLTGLTPGRDHYFAVVPVDGLGNFNPVISYSAAYVLSPQVLSREVSFFVGQDEVNPYREAVSREFSILVPDAAVPAPVTGLGSTFAVSTSTNAFGAVEMVWPGYDEAGQVDVVRYRVYVGPTYFEDVTGLTPYAYIQTGRQAGTVTGLTGLGIFYFAVVAEDALGNFNPTVRAVSGQASISGVGEVTGLAAISGRTSLHYSWTAPADAGDFLRGYRVYFGSATTPVELPPMATEFEATGLEPGTAYAFRISTLDPFGGESGGMSVFGGTLLPNPSNVRLTAVGDSVRLLWDPVQPAGLVGYYEVYRASSPFTDIAAATRIVADPVVGATLGGFADVAGRHYAVVAVNTLGGVDPTVVSVEATKQAQSIDFPPLAAGSLEIPLAAVASSGLPVVFDATPSNVATVDGSVLRVQRGGSIIVRASQDGNDDYWPASATQSLRLPPVITGFTANGTELAPGARLTTPEITLAVTALDAAGFSQAEFFGRVAGDQPWNSLGVDNVPGNGLSVVVPLAGLPEGAYEVRVVVTTPDAATASRQVPVVISLAPTLALTLGGSVVEGGSLAGTVSIAAPRPVDLLVTLTSSRPTQLNAGPPVTIPAGQTSAPFSLTGSQDSTIELPIDVRVTASATEATPVEAIVQLIDDDWPFLTLALDRTAVAESAGANAVVATLSREPATSQALTVALTNTLPSAVVAPASITFPAGESAVSFAVGVVDDAVTNGPRSATLKAEVRLQDTLISESDSVVLEIGDDEGPRLELLAARGWVLGGQEESVTARRLGASTTGPLTVSLTAAPDGRLVFPASVVIPAGAEEVAFSVTGVAGAEGAPATAVQLTGAATSFSPGQASIVVTDQELPDLVARNATAPTSVETEAWFEVGYRIENSGAAATATPFIQRLLLSSDPVVGNDVLLSQYSFNGPLNQGVGFDRVETVRAPREAGTYYILAVTDAGNAVAELLESNNSSVVAHPVVVTPAYTGFVQTTVTQVPANTPIPLTGSATRAGGLKVPNVMLNIHIRVNGTERLIAALTNSVGDFSTTWQPLPGEGGDYDIGAAHPGVPSAPTQDSFAILTVKTEFPTTPLAFDEGESAAFAGTLTNPTAYELTGLALAAIDAPAGLTVTPSLPATSLAPGESLQVGVALSGAAGFSGNQVVTLRLTSDQGVTVNVPVTVNVRALAPLLTLSPDPLKHSVLRGSQKTVSFTIQNSGGAESGPVTVALPVVPWIQLASPNPLPSIAPGASAAVDIQLSPSPTEALTLFSGHLVVAPANGAPLNLPFEFRTVSDLTGDLMIEVVDEYTFFTADAPRVAGATVTVRDAITAEELTRLDTDATGTATFQALPEGWYAIEVTAPKHARWKGNVFVNAGETTTRQTFISLELVSYNWTVEEIELEDRYRISVESTFETNVPAPVVTVTPAVLDVENLTTLGQTKVVNFTFENHGLIAAENGKFTFQQHPFYEVTPLIEDVGIIPPKSSITVPVIVRRIGKFSDDGEIQIESETPKINALGRRGRSHTSVPCTFGGALTYDFLCGLIKIGKDSAIPASGVEGRCPPGWPWNPGEGGGGGGGGGGWGGSIGQISFSLPSICDCESLRNKCIEGELGMKFGPLSEALKSALTTLLNNSPFPIKIFKFDVKWEIDGKLCICCEDGVLGWSGSGKAKAKIEVEIGIGAGASLPNLKYPATEWLDVSVSANVLLGTRINIKGEVNFNANRDCEGNGYMCGEGSLSSTINFGASVRGKATAKARDVLTVFSGDITGDAGVKGYISIRASVCDDKPFKIRACADIDLVASLIGKLEAEGFEARPLNLDGSLDLLSGCLGDEETDGSLGESGLRFLSLSEISDMNQVGAEDELLLGVEENRVFASIPQADLWMSTEEGVRLFEEQPDSGVCALVRLKVDQELVTTRSAFQASLELGNKHDQAPLEAVGFDLIALDASSLDAREHFDIRVTKLINLSSIDGIGELAPATTGSAQWTIIPRDTAAPAQDTDYFIGGTIRYTQSGTQFSIPVTPVRITVKPDAALYLKYFHQRDVFSDDPFTDALEPSEPYRLAVLVENRGAGAARNLSITSAQPQIIENEKGLLIDFKVIGTEVAGQNLSPSLTATLGELLPGQRKSAHWLLTSSLQGLFIDYDATFTHLDGLNDERISLIKEVEIHEMIRQIEALGAKADGQPDYLVNDVADIRDLPDTVHLSDGTTAPVAVLETAAVSAAPTAGELSVTLTAAMGSGWTYLRIPDPADGAFRLTGVRRSDGLVLPLDRNAWVTDRTFIGLGRRPIRENILHLVDCDSTGSYTLTYGLLLPADGEAPTSEVTDLPAESGLTFAVSWTGTDDQGIAGYDVFVRTNAGAWQPWLTDTTRTSALYTGELGKQYAFYSVARDVAGNIESKSPTAEAVTLVNRLNASPVIQPVADQSVSEGGTLEYQIYATDPDGPASGLKYEVQSLVAGVTIQPDGLLRWVTGESDGGSSVDVTVIVRDSGIPSASAQVSFRLVATEENAPPRVPPIAPQSVVAGNLFSLSVPATDTDVPAQTLAYALAGAPNGMTIDGTTGEIAWIPPISAGGFAYPIAVTVTDSGVPAASTTRTFSLSVLPAPPAPDLVVEYPSGSPLGDNGVLAFGESGLGRSVLRSVTIRNTGTATLTGLAVSLAGAQPDDFSAAQPVTGILPVGGETTVTLTFTPSAPGTRTAELRLQSSDERYQPFRLQLSGIGQSASTLVQTGEASEIATDSAVLAGTITPGYLPTEGFFEITLPGEAWSATSRLAALPAPLSVGQATTVGALATGLLPHTEYQFRLLAINESGTHYGDGVSFTTANTPPTFEGYTFDTAMNTAVSVALVKILARGADADGDVLSVAGAAAQSTEGGTVTVSDQELTYTPPAGFTGIDSVTITLDDGFGGTVEGMLVVAVLDGSGTTPNLADMQVLPNGSLFLVFQGIPGREYAIETSPDLVGWEMLEVVTATAQGTIGFIDSRPIVSRQFYRTAEVPE